VLRRRASARRSPGLRQRTRDEDWASALLGGLGVWRLAVGLAVLLGRRGRVRVDRRAEFGAQAAQIFEHGGAMVLELVDLVVDLAAAAQALLDGLGGLGLGFLAGAASVVVGVGAERLGVGLGLRAARRSPPRSDV